MSWINEPKNTGSLTQWTCKQNRNVNKFSGHRKKVNICLRRKNEDQIRERVILLGEMKLYKSI